LRYDDLRALGRLGEPVSVRTSRQRRLAVRRAGTATVATRRPVVPRPVVVVVLVVLVALTYLGVVASRQTSDLGAPAAGQEVGQVASTARTATAPRRAAAPAADRSVRSGVVDRDVFGRVDTLDLHLPHEAPLAVAFHEATRPEALPIDPLGRLLANDNATKYVAPADQPGPEYRVLSSRGRGRPATSAVDIVLPGGARATAPVTGTVVDVREYALSGGVRDWRVVIEPDARKDLHVVVIHLHQPQVEVGDRVTAGSSPLAVVRQLPFSSHVDYVLGERHPHVHVEVKPATATPRIDPNAPAVEPGAEHDVAYGG
jgi:hypothetical protein